MHAKRIAILVLVLSLPVLLLALLLDNAGLAQEGEPPPNLLPGEPLNVLQEAGLLPSGPEAAGLLLFKTVGTKPIVQPSDCADAEFLSFQAGTRVYYCYRIANTGSVALTKHTLVDSHFGTLFSNIDFTLPVGASAIFTQSAVISTSVVNVATWTASDASGTSTVQAGDRAGVFVAGPQPLACGGPAVNFDQGIPPDWQVVNHPNASPVYWTNVALSWENANYTGAGGDAAAASSQLQNGGSGLYDTELRSPAFSLNGAGAVSLRYQANYQHASNDALDLDISTNGGLTWTNLLRWRDSDHGNFRSSIGESVQVDLSHYSGLPNLILRWRYYDQTGPASIRDWYAQIDQVSLQCGTSAAIKLVRSATTSPDCSSGEVNLVAPGTKLTYCYHIFNTGPTPLDRHDLEDSQLGTILKDFNFNLRAGANAILPQTVTILTDTVSAATWTASNPALGISASASDSLTIRVGKPLFLPLTSFRFRP